MTDTFGDIKTRIADEISRSDLTSQIQTAVLSAIEYYEKRRFYFNEMRSLTFSTVAGQEFYTSSDAAGIAQLTAIDSVRITTSDTYALEPEKYDVLDAISESTTTDYGEPTMYAYFGRQFRLYPIPSSAWTVRVSGVKSLTTLSASSDTNAWTTGADAEALIRMRAKGDLYANVIRDDDEATKFEILERKELAMLIGRTGSLSGTGYVTATQF